MFNRQQNSLKEELANVVINTILQLHYGIKVMLYLKENPIGVQYVHHHLGRTVSCHMCFIPFHM